MDSGSEISLELVIDTMAEGLVVVDSGARIRCWNKSMAGMTGYDEGEMLGQSLFKLRAPGCASAEILGMLMSDAPENPGMVSGCECRMLSKAGEEIPVVVNARALRNGSGKIVGMLQTVSDCRPLERLRCEVEALQRGMDVRNDGDNMIGNSRAMTEVLRLMRLAAASDATVLISGESGTGKELLAAAIHRHSQRAKMPFVKVNCGALPEGLLESELFGHVKGAFTGALRDRVGRFEAAAGGSILLDEIGEIALSTQVKLLRALQEGEFERVGESMTRKVDVRVIAATNVNLAEAVKLGRFREDLYYRLKVFPVRLPALRERPEDIPLLIRHFITAISAKTGKSLRGIDPAAMAACIRHSWPGNVRELENTIEYAFVVCPDNAVIELQHLPPELHSSSTTSHAAAAFSAAGTLENAGHLRELLDECRWNKAEAARRLGVSRTLVWKWMKRHHMPLSPEKPS